MIKRYSKWISGYIEHNDGDFERAFEFGIRKNNIQEALRALKNESPGKEYDILTHELNNKIKLFLDFWKKNPLF